MEAKLTDVQPIRLNRREAAQYLKTVHGLSYTHGTLTKLASVGGGPKFRKPNSRVALYDRKELDRWANEKLGVEYASTAEIA